jgi:hypothetical protein
MRLFKVNHDTRTIWVPTYSAQQAKTDGKGLQTHLYDAGQQEYHKGRILGISE